MDTDSHGWNEDLTEAGIGSAFEVANVWGAGFLEKVYEGALLRELALRGVHAKGQVSFPVCYQGHYVGEDLADLVVEDKLVQLNYAVAPRLPWRRRSYSTRKDN